jgi:hypothetical protein
MKLPHLQKQKASPVGSISVEVWQLIQRQKYPGCRAGYETECLTGSKMGKAL